jgi:hypothetical protein
MKRRRLAIALTVFAVLGAGLFLTRQALLLRVGSAVAHRRSAAREEVNRFTVTADVADGWLPILRTDMDDAWKPVGQRGLNYFTFAAPESAFAPCSAREDPTSQRYQAWLGIYVVELGDRPAPDGEEALLKFADGLLRHDQLRWLRTMEDPDPQASVAARTRTDEVILEGRHLPIYEGEVQTHSDLGRGTSRIAGLLGYPSDFERHVDAHHPLSLEGFVTFWSDPGRRAIFVAYGNGVRFKNRAGTEVRTYPALRPELIRMLESVRVTDL